MRIRGTMQELIKRRRDEIYMIAYSQEEEERNIRLLEEYSDSFSRHQDVKSVMIYSSNTRNINPLISFIIPTAGRPDTLYEALESIVGQNSEGWEIVVVDNSGNLTESDKDEIRKKLKKLDCSNLDYYVNEKNIGMVGNFNRSIELARGKWVSMLHDDDLLDGDYVSAILKCFRNPLMKKRVGLIRPKYVYFKDGERLPPLKKRMRGGLCRVKIFDSLLKGTGPSPGPTCGTLFLKSAVMECGGFCEELYPSMDHILGYQIQRKGYLTLETEDELGYYRIARNASTKKETFLGFAIKDTTFRRLLYRYNRFYGLCGLLFEGLNYSLMIDKLVTFAKRGFIKGLKREDLDFLHNYRRYPLKRFCYKVIRKAEFVFSYEKVHV